MHRIWKEPRRWLSTPSRSGGVYRCCALTIPGTGSSSGSFQGDLGRSGSDDALAVLDRPDFRAPLVLVGSSMGGVDRRFTLQDRFRPERVQALIGIAAAPDFTGVGLSLAQIKKALELQTGRLVAGPAPEGAVNLNAVVTGEFWKSGVRSQRFFRARSRSTAPCALSMANVIGTFRSTSRSRPCLASVQPMSS